MIQLFRELYKDKFFYQLYIQEEGIAEAEFEADVRKALEITYFSSDGRGMQFMIENIGNPEYQKTPDSTMLEKSPRFDSFPDWLTQEDLNYFINEFEHSGFAVLLIGIELRISILKSYRNLKMCLTLCLLVSLQVL